MLVARQGRRHRAGRARLTRATSASRCPSAPPRVPRRPRRRSHSSTGCSEERRVRDARGETGPPAQSRALATYESDVSVALILRASESAAAPSSPIWLFLPSLQRVEEVRDARGETGPPAKSRARATYESDVSVVLLLSASESAAAPASPI